MNYNYFLLENYIHSVVLRGPNPLADMDPGGPNPLADMDLPIRGGPNPLGQQFKDVRSAEFPARAIV